MPRWKQRAVRSKEGMNVVAAPVLDKSEIFYYHRIILVVVHVVLFYDHRVYIVNSLLLWYSLPKCYVDNYVE